MRDELEKMIDRIAATEPEQGDYTDPATGLLCCGQCHTLKHTHATIGLTAGVNPKIM